MSPTYEQIQERAYQIWQEKGCTHGHDAEDWLQAEAELNKGACASVNSVKSRPSSNSKEKSKIAAKTSTARKK